MAFVFMNWRFHQKSCMLWLSCFLWPSLGCMMTLILSNFWSRPSDGLCCQDIYLLNDREESYVHFYFWVPTLVGAFTRPSHIQGNLGSEGYVVADFDSDYLGEFGHRRDSDVFGLIRWDCDSTLGLLFRNRHSICDRAFPW